MATAAQIEAAARTAYERNRAGSKEWSDISEQHRAEWRLKVAPIVDAALETK